MVLTASRIARQVVAPTLVAYLAFLLALRAGFRTPTRRTPASAPPASLGDWARLVRLLAATALGGQGPGFVADSLGSGAMLALAVVVPSFLVMEAARALLRRLASWRASRDADP